MASPIFLRGDRSARRVQQTLAAMVNAITIRELTPRDDVSADLRFEMQYYAAGVDHAAAVEHLLNWLDAYDPQWRTYLSVGLPGGTWT